jgi:hypothetical protein
MKFAELLRVFPGQNDVGGIKTVCEGIFGRIRFGQLLTPVN